MNELQEVLQISAKLYSLLGESNENRDELIEEVNEKLTIRGQKITLLKQAGFQFDNNNKTHMMLYELDKGIQERLQLAMNHIKGDLKQVQIAKKNEKQYTNPYGHVQIMDGMYYDKKK